MDNILVETFFSQESDDFVYIDKEVAINGYVVTVVARKMWNVNANFIEILVDGMLYRQVSIPTEIENVVAIFDELETKLLSTPNYRVRTLDTDRKVVFISSVDDIIRRLAG